MKIKTLFVAGLVLALMVGLVGTAGLAAAPPEKVDVFVAFDRQPGPAEEALVRAAGGNIRYTYWLVPAIAASLPQAAIDGLARNPRVTVIEPVLAVYAVDTELDDTWGVKRIGAGTVHDSGNLGTGIKVAVIDTGIDYSHPELTTNYKGGYDFVNGDTDPMDDNGHGTHVAGTIAALDNGSGVVGVAPRAELYALKILGADGSGSFDDVIAALQWAVEKGIQVTNNSYGSSSDPGTTVKNAFDNSYDAGVLHVSSAGNSGNPASRGDNVGYPANYSSVIAVAASDSNDRRASFSSTGPAVELIAPGVDILSTYLDGQYAYGSGTSMASPHVAGVAALVRAADSTLPNAQVRSILQQTAEDLGLPWDHQGYGLVRADLAVKGVEPPTTYTITATAGTGGTIDPSGDVVVNEGDSQTFSISPDTGYEISDVLVDDVSVGAVSSYTFENVTADHTIHATFASVPTYTITATAGEGGTIDPSGDVVVSEGDSQTFTITANTGYEIDDVMVDGSSVGAVSSYTFDNVTSDHTIHAAFREAAAAGVVSVESITYSTSGGRYGVKHLAVTVLLVDDLDQPVTNASVSATLYGETGSWDFQGTTGSDGSVTFALNNHGSGCYDTVITAVVASGLTWDGVTPENGYCK